MNLSACVRAHLCLCDPSECRSLPCLHSAKRLPAAHSGLCVHPAPSRIPPACFACCAVLCRVVLFLAGADSSACMVGLDKGEPVGRSMRPKNASRPLSLALLDAGGIPLPLLHGQLVLHWANNNSSTAPRTLAAMGRAGSMPADDVAGRVARPRCVHCMPARSA